MNKSLLDTDVLSEIIKGKNTSVRHRCQEYLQAFGRLTTSVITLMEAVKGFHKQHREDTVAELLKEFELLEVLHLTPPAAVLAGRILGDLESTGQPIGRADPIIAAIAIHERLRLVTGNIKHFQRIITLGYDLELEDWKE